MTSTRFTLSHRFALGLLGVCAAALGGFLVLNEVVFEPDFEASARETMQLRLEARALPLVTRFVSMDQGLIGMSEDLARAGDADAMWLTSARGFLQTWPEADRIFGLREGDPSSELVPLRREGQRLVEGTTGDEASFLTIAEGFVGVQRMAGESVVDPAFCVHEDDAGVAHGWLVRASRDARVVLGIRLRAGLCEASLQSLQQLAGEEVALIDAHGHQLGHGDRSRVFSAPGFRRLLRNPGHLTSTAEIEVDGVPTMVAYHRDPRLGLAVAYAVPREIVFDPFTRTRDLALGLIALVGLAGALVQTRLLATLRGRLQRVTRSMRLVARGDLAQRLPVEGGPEFADLSRAYNTMLSDLHTSHTALRVQSERLASALREVEDVEAMKDSFLALVSHEVRTPLTSIMGGIEFLREEFKEDRTEIEAEFIEIVYDSARRLAGFMNDAILMASLQANRSRADFELFSLTGLLQGKIDVLEPLRAQQGVTIENRVEAQRELVVLGDWTLMQVALEKVLHNALRHNEPEGRVVVEVVERVLEDPDGDLQRMMTARAVDPLDASMHWRALRVFNTGPIIPAAKIGQLFERFELTHDISNHQRGSGLSLPIANYVLGYHGGCIEVRAVDDWGMAFYLVLPARLGAQPRKPDDVDVHGVDETVAAARMVAAERGVCAVTVAGSEGRV